MKRIAVLALCALLLPWSAGCHRHVEPVSAGRPRGPQAFAGSPKPTRAQEISATPIAAALNDLAFRLARETERSRPDAGMLISPLSVATAHAMLLAGARGDARKDLAKALGLDAFSPDRVDAAMFAVDHAVTHTQQRELQLANAFFACNPLKLEPAFRKALRLDYDADYLQLHGAGPDSLARINGWAKKKTAGMIPKVLDSLSLQTLCVIADAATFHGAWERPFDPDDTRESAFALASGQVIQVPTMHMEKAEIRLRDERDLTIAAIPYSSGEFQMVIILPAKGSSASKVIAEMTGERWFELLRAMSEYKLDLSLPKFSFGARYDLKPILTALGAGRLFYEADLTGIARKMDNAWVDQDVHATHIEVDEVGTRAAAATEMPVVIGFPRKRDSFLVDRPFVYAIVHTRTNAIAFLGVCMDPRTVR